MAERYVRAYITQYQPILYVHLHVSLVLTSDISIRKVTFPERRTKTKQKEFSFEFTFRFSFEFPSVQLLLVVLRLCLCRCLYRTLHCISLLYIFS